MSPSVTRASLAHLLAGPFAGLSLLAAAGCSSQAKAPSAATATPVSSEESGRLEQLVSDSNGDGKLDTRAIMDGTLLTRIEIDRHGDERPDRFDHYRIASLARASTGFEIDRVEETNGLDHRITRVEIYERGTLIRVEEDTDGNGHIDKWEHHDRGVMARIDLDLNDRGRADRRLFYRADGTVERVEVDPDGRGDWRPLAPVTHQ
jgi:hypothetical protein